MINDSIYIDNIACNTEVNLQILTPTQAIRLKTRLIGVDPNMSIILAMNTDREWIAAKNFMEEGQGVIVRLVNFDEPEANIIAFRTHIQKTMSLCGRWLVLDYPNKFQKVALRNYSRIAIHVECKILDEHSPAVLSEGYLHDISINGCGFIGESINECSLDKSYLLQIEFPKNDKKMVAPVTVKNIGESMYHHEEKQYGLVFDVDNQVTQEFIQQAVLHHMSVKSETE